MAKKEIVSEHTNARYEYKDEYGNTVVVDADRLTIYALHPLESIRVDTKLES